MNSRRVPSIGLYFVAPPHRHEDHFTRSDFDHFRISVQSAVKARLKIIRKGGRCDAEGAIVYAYEAEAVLGAFFLVFALDGDLAPEENVFDFYHFSYSLSA
jgi:hypothetical protein